MHRTFVVLAFASLAACSGRSDGELTPGNWRQTVTVKSATLPDAPAAMQAQVAQITAAMAGKTESRDQCMSPAEAKAGIESMSRGLQEGNCTSEGVETGDGKMTGRMTCTQGTTHAELALNGTYEPEKVVINADMTMTEPRMPGGKVKVAMELVATRIGECPAS